MILDNEFTGDMRVENEVMSLRAAGYEVVVFCFNFGGKPETENFHGAHIVRLSVQRKLVRKTKALINFYVDPYSWWWARRIVQLVPRYGIDVLHVHDLFMLPASLRARRRLASNIMLVADLHENYPAALKHYRFARTFPGRLVVSLSRWQRKEVEWLGKVDRVITVIEEAIDRYVGLGVHPDKLHVVANYVNRHAFLTATPPGLSLEERFSDRFVVSYIGGFDLHRGLEHTLEAVALLAKSIPHLSLLLIGHGSNREEVEAQAASLGIADRIILEGWQRPDRLPAYISASNVCLIPHLKTVHTDNTIPHKLFQYMLLQRPVVAANCAPLDRILRDTQAGLVYRSGNVEALAEAILRLYRDPALCREMGRRGKEAVDDRYNWLHTASELLRMYQELAAERFSTVS